MAFSGGVGSSAYGCRVRSRSWGAAEEEANSAARSAGNIWVVRRTQPPPRRAEIGQPSLAEETRRRPVRPQIPREEGERTGQECAGRRVSGVGWMEETRRLPPRCQ